MVGVQIILEARKIIGIFEKKFKDKVVLYWKKINTYFILKSREVIDTKKPELRVIGSLGYTLCQTNLRLTICCDLFCTVWETNITS